jgi:plasmid stabilization system protein ParE
MKKVSTNFRLLQPARQELREAAHYYETCAPDLGHDFLKEVREAIQRILRWPHAWHPLDQEIRRCRTRHFPYAVIYAVENGEVVVVSVMNLRRHPDSWRKNLS